MIWIIKKIAQKNLSLRIAGKAGRKNQTVGGARSPEEGDDGEE